MYIIFISLFFQAPSSKASKLSSISHASIDAKPITSIASPIKQSLVVERVVPIIPEDAASAQVKGHPAEVRGKARKEENHVALPASTDNQTAAKVTPEHAKGHAVTFDPPIAIVTPEPQSARGHDVTRDSGRGPSLGTPDSRLNSGVTPDGKTTPVVTPDPYRGTGSPKSPERRNETTSLPQSDRIVAPSNANQRTPVRRPQKKHVPAYVLDFFSKFCTW